jgi:hypothetical protein
MRRQFTTELAATVALLLGSLSFAAAGTPDAIERGQVVAFLDFYRRWDTPAQDHAGEVARTLIRQAADFEAFRRLAPEGSTAREAFLEHFASFEDEAELVRSGRVPLALMMEGWYGLPDGWIVASRYIVGIRQERRQPGLCAGMEWLAGLATRYWEDQKLHPPQWQPDDRAPTPADREVLAAFDRVWSTPRDVSARRFLDEVSKQGKTPEDFARLAPSGSSAYTQLDRVMCAYDLAGELIKFGAVNPGAFFTSWPSPAEVWRKGGPWVLSVRARSPSRAGYDSAEWLVDYEREWRKRHPPTQ